jgi:hypothetical protein
MSEERKKILEMLSEGKISVSEAEALFDALSQAVGDDNTAGQQERKTEGKRAKFLNVCVNPKHGGKGKVNIRVPLQLIRAGVKLASVMPKDVGDKVSTALKDKGINMDLNDIDAEKIEDIISCLSDLTVEVDDDKEFVSICCE